jgi:hypothetical protein
LGLKMTVKAKLEMFDLAQAVNPDIRIFETSIDKNGALSFRERSRAQIS